MKKKALITGITGQSGSYLAELLLDSGYEVFGMIRRSSTDNFSNIKNILDEVNLEYGDLLDLPSLHRIMRYIEPDEIYNLAAQSHVGISFEQPLLTVQTTGMGALNMLESFRNVVPYSRFYQAGSSEMFGNSNRNLLDETDPFNPASPYACSKVFAHNIACNYRRSYNLFICNGILFNHESPRRGSNFVTQKIVQGAVKIAEGKQNKIKLGNLAARRDWGHAKDYVDAMWRMLQQEKPDDYVIATGISTSVAEFCRLTFEKLDLDYTNYIQTDTKFYRPEDVAYLAGNYSKAKAQLDWEPKHNLSSLITDMIRSAKEK